MVYYISRFLIRLALPIFLKRLLVQGHKKLHPKSPYLLASNHPDSFFDAVVIGSVLDQPIHTLTRGDVFRKPKVAFWLRQINLIPVFRGSEGREHVKKHDITTQESIESLKGGGTVVVFSEGICKNEWNLRSLGKGTARMAYEIWYGTDGIPDMRVVPTGLNYETFRGPGKRVVLNFGTEMSPNDLQTDPKEYEKWLREFNEILTERMNEGIFSVSDDLPLAEQKLAVRQYFDRECPAPDRSNGFLKAIGSIGRGLHAPLYRFFSAKAAKLTARSVFYDSVLFGFLVYLYPLLVVILSMVIGALAGWPAALATFIALPTLAWLGAQYR
ncbi:1-acyl-sn-glycerol-3-phosphate acyltransferase [Dyadobacter jejuensis]|uniref:1-acyl-sn-glycerol-3-phosphate acyltransferase n=1 Tax=Dyadobacter jejuensis TaxID=1082580 RepID=A0A316AHY4_9BACT|nr:1-acyl-sn-glycerol-3-phosphate acyltransferase [Dyadobacter jejuensis]PWJ56564.1 1-acyl-sn-glycerol-3-phosphate acyltransferase [Dyadobacter jejuensis]